MTSALTNQRRIFKLCLTQTKRVSDDVTRKIGPLGFTTRLQFANNNIAEGTLSASLLLSKQSAAPSIKLISVASILKFECPTWNSNLKHYLTCIQINCYCGPNGNSWAGPPTNLHDKKLSNQGLSMNIQIIHSICKIAYVKVWHCLFSHNFLKRFVDALFNPFLICQVF